MKITPVELEMILSALSYYAYSNDELSKATRNPDIQEHFKGVSENATRLKHRMTPRLGNCPYTLGVQSKCDEKTVAIIDDLFYQLYHIVAGEQGDPTKQHFAITSVHEDLLSIAKGEI